MRLFKALRFKERFMLDYSFAAPRRAQTTMPCKKCGRPVLIARTCHEVTLHCEACRKDYRVQDYLPEMDEAMESFMENVNCDRV